MKSKLKDVRRRSADAGSPGMGLSAGRKTARRVPSWKRFLDVSIIGMAVPLWATLMLGIVVLIKSLSPGPVLFRQERVGFRGRRFICLKFRTMHTGAATVAHENHLAELMRSDRPMTKLDGQDSRLIPLAWMLRSTGLDELPQLFNVLRGEMSLVGPRPCTPREYNAYSRAQRARLTALPGLTGLWQVNGKNHTTFKEMIELDIRYARTQCLWLDIGIMLRTPMVLLVQLAETLVSRKARRSLPDEKLPSSARRPAKLSAGLMRSSTRDATATASFGCPQPMLFQVHPSSGPPHLEAVQRADGAAPRLHPSGETSRFPSG